ncbi:MAG: tRNA guanosine(34) transglycosylase Tgt [Spirochaetes bacterium]|nr:MAG: tRNA guanosine(34) transglycosylase Tgt [Spirochaetota bacterium]
MYAMRFDIEHRDPGSGARAGLITTARGEIHTPVFMPVATRGAIRALAARDVLELGFEIILANTYHLYLKPGTAVLDAAGGLHRFMNFERPILTDSGGFQVFSLADFCKIMDHGVEFRSHLDGSKHLFTPESVLEVQRSIGSDIMMVLDHCSSYPASPEEARGAVERTVRWAGLSRAHWGESFDTDRQTLFGIVQGSVYPELRRECAARLGDMDFPGYAIGGLSVGEPKELYREITGITCARLPDDRPRYMMGVGSPMEILHAVSCGVDMFDCVMPTRIARNGTLYTSRGRVHIKAAAHERDFGPLDPECGCYVCSNFSRAYLRHIYRAGEVSALIYNTYHNLHFMRSFMRDVREGIVGGRFAGVAARWGAVFGGEPREA